MTSCRRKDKTCPLSYKLRQPAARRAWSIGGESARGRSIEDADQRDAARAVGHADRFDSRLARVCPSATSATAHRGRPSPRQSLRTSATLVCAVEHRQRPIGRGDPARSISSGRSRQVERAGGIGEIGAGPHDRARRRGGERRLRHAVGARPRPTIRLHREPHQPVGRRRQPDVARPSAATIRPTTLGPIQRRITRRTPGDVRQLRRGEIALAAVIGEIGAQASARNDRPRRSGANDPAAASGATITRPVACCSDEGSAALPNRR